MAWPPKPGVWLLGGAGDPAQLRRRDLGDPVDDRRRERAQRRDERLARGGVAGVGERDVDQAATAQRLGDHLERRQVEQRTRLVIWRGASAAQPR